MALGKNTASLHWDYFRLLEKDLLAIGEVVEICEDNFDVYGPRILQLILSAGGEVDTALKSFGRVVAPESNYAKAERLTMGDHREMICSYARNQFAAAEVRFLHTDVVMAPWAPIGAGDKESLAWWKAYNKVKHERDLHYASANLKTALELMGALFIVDAYLFEAACQEPGFSIMTDWSGDHLFMPQLEDYLGKADGSFA